MRVILLIVLICSLSFARERIISCESIDATLAISDSQSLKIRVEFNTEGIVQRIALKNSDALINVDSNVIDLISKELFNGIYFSSEKIANELVIYVNLVKAFSTGTQRIARLALSTSAVFYPQYSSIP